MVEVGGLDFLPDGRLVVSTRHGQVWIVENPCAPDPADARMKLFAGGLYEGLGLAVVNGEIFVLQRTEPVAPEGHRRRRHVRHDRDDQQRLGRLGQLPRIRLWPAARSRRQLLHLAQRRVLRSQVVARQVARAVPRLGAEDRARRDDRSRSHAAFRSPNGSGFNGDGDLFVTDNQGDWMPSCPLYHVEKGEFYGHPASLEWTDDYFKFERKASDTEPPPRPRRQPALWIPYGLSRSAGNPTVDSTAGKFGAVRRPDVHRRS